MICSTKRGLPMLTIIVRLLVPWPTAASRASAGRPTREQGGHVCRHGRSPTFAMIYLVPGSSEAHATWKTTGAPTVLVLSLVTLNGHRCGPSIRYTPSGATGVGAVGRAPWPTLLAIAEAMAARIRHASTTPETQRRRAGRLAPNCTTS
jgi:hypothetical protein